MAPQPVVTGLSPKEGPPGTRITIRGEFLGTRASDLIGKFQLERDQLQQLKKSFCSSRSF